MKTQARRAVGMALALAAVAGAGRSWAQQGLPARAELADGREVPGRLEAGLSFRPEGPGEPIGLGSVRSLRFESAGPDAALGVPPFVVELGRTGRISGRLVSVDGESVRLVPAGGSEPLAIRREGVRALVQRPGEAQVFRDGFETLDRSRWLGLVGEASLSRSPVLVGDSSLRLPAGGSALTAELEEPVGSGVLEVAYHDDGNRVAGQRWFVDLTFRGGESEQATIRAVLGWSEETLAVESPNGPRLHVQRLLRRPGWHRLVVRFGPEATELSVDGDELAFGRPGLGMPLEEIRVATETVDNAAAARGLAAYLDDLSLSRRSEPFGSLESEPALDEVRMSSGDQLFGKVESADESGVSAEVGGSPIRLAWSEVSGLHFRRSATASEPVAGWLARVEWAASASEDERGWDRVEGALAVVGDAGLSVDVPYVGRIEIPSDRLRRVEVLERVRRVVLDPGPYHLGDRFASDLDPPRPEPEPLELGFVLGEVPGGAAFLSLDVVQVIGEEGTPGFSAEVKAGNLRTHVILNDMPLEDLNPQITTTNERPERVRLEIPPGTLRVGRNVLRFEQTGTKADPSKRDNLGLLGVALEVPLAGGVSQP